MKAQHITIVGAGPAGMMAGIRAAACGAEVVVIEKNACPGAKLLLSGKGRCNLTNTAGLQDFLARFPSNGQFLRDAFKKFFNTDLIRFFEERGVELIVERQQRVFPATGRSGSIVDVLSKELARQKVQVLSNTAVKGLIVKQGCVEGVVLAGNATMASKAVILATGGVSYRATGSTGDGIRWARDCGHRIVPLRPGLVALVTKKEGRASAQGLTLKNIRLTFRKGKKEIVSEVGELLFTDFGISGPLVLTHSGIIADWLSDKGPVSVGIDFKPGLSGELLDARLMREFRQAPRKNWPNVLKGLLPKSMIPVFLERLGMRLEKKANQVNQHERSCLVALLKDFHLEVLATRPMDEAMVTRGGVSVKDVDPRTMQSRVIKGLYCCGEMLDVDADTGGFNLQAAFSTGYLAGESAAQSAHEIGSLNNQ